MELARRTVLVTGAGSGIGRAIALRIAQDQAAIVICVDKDPATAAETSERIAASGVESYSIAIDLADEVAIDMLAKIVLEKHGVIDVLVSNAGVSFEGGLDTPESGWTTSWDVNLMAQVRLARLLVPSMIANGGGYVVNTASAAGLLTSLGALSYAVTKHASVAFSEWLAITHRPDNIRVSALCPMGVRTKMLFPERDDGQASARLAQSAVLESGELLEPEQVANRVVEAINSEEFLILPHPQVHDFYTFRANNTAKWIASMAKYRERLVAE